MTKSKRSAAAVGGTERHNTASLCLWKTLMKACMCILPHPRQQRTACRHTHTLRNIHTLHISSLACGSLQSQAIQRVITVILIIYKEESEIPRHAHTAEREGGGGNQVGLFQSNFPLQSQLSP